MRDAQIEWPRRFIDQAFEMMNGQVLVACPRRVPEY
jgi:hypothetical protein